MQHSGGWWLDRLPAWISWATIPEGVMGAKYDGIYWNPPAEHKHKWCAGYSLSHLGFGV